MKQFKYGDVIRLKTDRHILRKTAEGQYDDGLTYNEGYDRDVIRKGTLYLVTEQNIIYLNLMSQHYDFMLNVYAVDKKVNHEDNICVS